MLLVFQVAVISLIAIQYALIGKYGETVEVLQKSPDPDMYDYQDDGLYIDYEINYIPKNKWDLPKNIKHNEKVFVLLEANNDGLYEPVKATGKSVNTKGNQIVLSGKYQEYASEPNRKRVDYGIEHIRKNQYSKLDQQKQWIITLQIAPWGQKKIVDIKEK
jgi:hypothetical protein